MKLHSLLFAACVISMGAQAQEISDAIRYSQDNLNGTARFRAMGGAFGALGGDFSAINVNPAGSAIFANNQVGFTVSSFNTTNKAGYFGTEATENDYSFDVNQAGGVFVYENEDEESDWKKFALTLNYENTNNLENTIFSAGTNPNNSIANYFLGYANGNSVPLNVLQDSFYEQLSYGDAQAFLGYQGYIINPEVDEPGNTVYVSNIPDGGNYYQENSFASTGFNGKLSFNGAASYKDKLYIGLNLNSHFTDYRQSASFYERNENDATAGLQRLRFNNDLYTTGSGFSFQLGAIAKVTESFRAGISYESPTWYRLNDELSQSLSSVRVEDEQTLSTIVDPQITLIYDTYKLQTPGKYTGSLAYVFGKTGLISIDYAIKDYSNVKFRPENDFLGVNNAMSDLLDTAAEIRVGAEHRIKKWSLRAGYRFEESPYKNGETIGDLSAISGGIGYNFGDTKLDISYTHAQREYDFAAFSQGMTDAARINSKQNNVSVTLLFEL